MCKKASWASWSCDSLNSLNSPFCNSTQPKPDHSSRSLLKLAFSSKTSSNRHVLKETNYTVAQSPFSFASFNVLISKNSREGFRARPHQLGLCVCSPLGTSTPDDPCFAQLFAFRSRDARNMKQYLWLVTYLLSKMSSDLQPVSGKIYNASI